MVRAPFLALALFLAAAPAALACGDDAAGCGVCSTPAAAAPAKAVAGTLKSSTFKVAMNCERCAAGIANALGKVPGVAGVATDFAHRTVTVTHGQEADLAAMNAALKGHFKLEAVAN